MLIILGSPGPESWEAIENGDNEMGGRIPINPSSGLIGFGHPVGATGAPILLDSFKQTTGNANDYQSAGAKNVATPNTGGSASTTLGFIAGC